MNDLVQVQVQVQLPLQLQIQVQEDQVQVSMNWLPTTLGLMKHLKEISGQEISTGVGLQAMKLPLIN